MIKYASLHGKGLEFNKAGDVGLDLRSLENVVLIPGEKRLIKTGTNAILPEGYGALVTGRSGITRDTHLRVNLGVIDTNYRGDIGIMTENYHPESKADKVLNKVRELLGKEKKYKKSITIERGDRIAQLVPFKSYVGETHRTTLYDIENDKTERGSHGYGQSGLK